MIDLAEAPRELVGLPLADVVQRRVAAESGGAQIAGGRVGDEGQAGDHVRSAPVAAVRHRGGEFPTAVPAGWRDREA